MAHDADVTAEAQRIRRVAAIGVIAVDVEAEAHVYMKLVHRLIWSAPAAAFPWQAAVVRPSACSEGRQSAGR